MYGRVLPEISDIDIIAIQRENMHTNIMKNIAKAQDKQSRDYDLNHGAGSSQEKNLQEKKAWRNPGVSFCNI